MTADLDLLPKSVPSRTCPRWYTDEGKGKGASTCRSAAASTSPLARKRAWPDPLRPLGGRRSHLARLGRSIESFKLEQAGDPPPEGIGAIRVYRQRTYHRPRPGSPTGPRPPFRVHLALGPAGAPTTSARSTSTVGPAGGTTIHWRSSFYPSRRGTGWIVERAIRRFLGGCTNGLAAYTAASKAADVV